MTSKIVKLIFCLLLSLIIGFGVSIFYLQQFITETSLPIKAPGYVLLVPPGTSVQKMADQMASDGLLKYPKLFVWWVFASGLSSQLKAGEYLIKEGSSPQDVIDLLTSGKVLQHSLTIIEGWNFETLMQAVNQTPELSHTLAGLTTAEIMTKLGYPNEHPEGRFFPDTYYFPLGTTDLAFLQRAYSTMQEKLQNAWEKRTPGVAVETAYQALTLASIIEKETNLKEEFHEISGVFHRRLQRGMPLQADPTVIYAAGKAYNGIITAELLKLPNPYNTYVNSGLPPTPIAMPSEKAVLAAMQPKEGNTLFFVAKPNAKGHIFSKTLQAHQAAVNHYRQMSQGKTLPLLKEAKPGASIELNSQPTAPIAVPTVDSIQSIDSSSSASTVTGNVSDSVNANQANAKDKQPSLQDAASQAKAPQASATAKGKSKAKKSKGKNKELIKAKAKPTDKVSKASASSKTTKAKANKEGAKAAKASGKAKVPAKAASAKEPKVVKAAANNTIPKASKGKNANTNTKAKSKPGSTSKVSNP